jgi:hypothetical protein
MFIFKSVCLLVFGLFSLFQGLSALPTISYYTAVNAATHQTEFNTLSSQGYRIISLNVHGPSSSAEYSALWIQRPGPGWVAIHGVSASAYQSWFDEWSGKGYISTIVSATGAIGLEVFAGVMEQISVASWYQKCGLTAAQFEDQNAGALASRTILKNFDEYGTSSDRRYCGVWQASPNVDKSTLFTGLSAADYQTIFNQETTKPYWRPTVLSVSEDISCAALFTDTSVGNAWYARHDLTTTDLATVVTSQKQMAFT